MHTVLRVLLSWHANSSLPKAVARTICGALPVPITMSAFSSALALPSHYICSDLSSLRRHSPRRPHKSQARDRNKTRTSVRGEKGVLHHALRRFRECPRCCSSPAPSAHERVSILRAYLCACWPFFVGRTKS